MLALLAAGTAALLLVIAASGWYFLVANRSHLERVTTSARLSLVVLPFANLSGDPAQDYLADALTDELTTAIARVRDSFVIARNTAFTYKGKPVDAKAIGKDLGVRYVLEGSVQPSGDQVRVNAQLIDAESGAHLWAEQFDTARADLLHMQDEIVTHLARALDINSPRSRPLVSSGRPGEPKRRGFGAPMQGGHTESRLYRQGSGRGFLSLRTGACDRSQQCPRFEADCPSSSIYQFFTGHQG